MADGRATRASIENRFASRISQWYQVRHDVTYYNAWFKDKLRMNKTSFDRIVAEVTEAWPLVNQPLHHNTFFDIEHRVAIALAYYATKGSVHEAATLLGAGRPNSNGYIYEVTQVLVKELRRRYVKMPSTPE